MPLTDKNYFVFYALDTPASASFQLITNLSKKDLNDV